MTIAEMEPLIDGKGLKKLEVKLRRAHEVDYFICTTKKVVRDEDERANYGDLIVFENDGQAWLKRMAKWWDDEAFDIALWHRRRSRERMLTVNGYQMRRAHELDLARAVGHEGPEETGR